MESVKKTAGTRSQNDNSPSPAGMSRALFVQRCKNEPDLLHPLLRLFLLSDGTVLHFLEGLFLGDVAFELAEQQEILLTDNDVARLSVERGEKGIQRNGWFCVNARRHDQGEHPPEPQRIIYTVSLLPIARLSPDLYHALQLRKKPLGQMLYDRQMTFRRDLVEIGQSLLPEIARGFGFSSETPLWTRRCHLVFSGAREGSGMLFEVFSPNIPLFWAQHSNSGIP